MCNHPELFERRDAKSPLFVELPYFEVPKLLYEELLLDIPSKRHILYNMLYIFNTYNISESLTNDTDHSTFSFLEYLNISPMEIWKIMMGDLIFRYLYEKLRN